jgi:lipid-A-disaccharide synthase
MKRVFIIAGEASGDILGAKLMQSMAEASPHITFNGVGGENMIVAGLDSIFPISDIALMGFAEIVPHMWRILNRLRQTCDGIAAFDPDLIITIDAPGFNVRVIEWVRMAYGDAIPCVHYVAPTVWAYKPERAAKFAKLFDHLLCILPFEPPYFTAHQMRADFVGHYIADGFMQTNYQHWNEDETLELLLFPGSRASEVRYMLPVFAEAIKLMQPYFPNINVYIAAHSLSASALQIDDWSVQPKLLFDRVELEKKMLQAHLAITKNGTVTLEIAKAGLPMVACYKVNKITAHFVRKMLQIPYVNLLNILQRSMNIPELLQESCNAENIANHAMTIIKNPQIAMSQVTNNQAALLQLANKNAIPSSDYAAKIIIQNYL